MPKRPKTPELGDEGTYFTINYPYPRSANMEYPDDRRNLAIWLGCVVDPDDLLAIYHKPSVSLGQAVLQWQPLNEANSSCQARNMVIVGVQKTANGIERMLGAHRWSSFLRECPPQWANLNSSIFYCHYGEDRKVQKAGDYCLLD